MTRPALRPRELAVLEAIATFRHATIDLLAQWTGKHPSDMRRVLPELSRQGLIRKQGRIGSVAVWALSNKGARTLGLRSRNHDRILVATARHDLAVAEAMLIWRAEGWRVSPTPMIIHEFDLDNDIVIQPKRAYTRRVGRISTHIYVPRAMLSRIIPDFEATHEATADAVAVEVELSRKPPKKVLAKMDYYLHQDVWQKVIYYTDDSGVERLLRQCIEETKTHDLIEVRRIRFPDYLNGWGAVDD